MFRFGHHPAIVVIAIGIDEQIFSKEITFSNHPVAPEPAVIFQLHCALAYDEQAREFYPIEFQLVEFEDVLF